MQICNIFLTLAHTDNECVSLAQSTCTVIFEPQPLQGSKGEGTLGPAWD